MATVTDNLITWLPAQLDDDERVARQLIASPGGFYIEAETEDTDLMAAGAHVHRWSPARALAEVEAKRRIIDLHPAAGLRSAPESCGSCVSYPGPCDTLRLLALPYADRPGYREEWRP
ncbi:DUF6221 family protein [Micromonospora carbonacea]|uniref:Uncharacterized protein n=1 Tax=Micromonospora carbonacea TaxID=47853 RepID=A0A1C5ACD1_9ACTN|nr:DUF6221 family protein [Micromonospora carbonacea]SCF42853.1 hypothetical protein GA0070563_112142 [Micromonospora carbonacea]